MMNKIVTNCTQKNKRFQFFLHEIEILYNFDQFQQNFQFLSRKQSNLMNAYIIQFCKSAKSLISKSKYKVVISKSEKFIEREAASFSSYSRNIVIHFLYLESYCCHKVLQRMLMDPSTDRINKYLAKELLKLMIRNLNKAYDLIKQYIETHQIIVNIGKENSRAFYKEGPAYQNNSSISEIAFGQFLQILLWLAKDLVILLNIKKDYNSQMKIFNQISAYFSTINNFSKKKKIRFRVNQLQVKCLNMVYLYRTEEYQAGAKYCKKLVTHLYQFIFTLSHKTGSGSKQNSHRYQKAVKNCYKLLLFALLYQAYFHVVENNYHPLEALITILKRIQTIDGPKELVKYYQNYSQIMVILQNSIKAHQDFQFIFENNQIFSLPSIKSIIENSDKVVRKKQVNSQDNRKQNKKYYKLKNSQNNNQFLSVSGSISNRSKIPSRINEIQLMKDKKDIILQGSNQINSTNNFKKEDFAAVMQSNTFKQQPKTSNYLGFPAKKVAFCQNSVITSSDKSLDDQRCSKQNKRSSIASSSSKSFNKPNVYSSLHHVFLCQFNRQDQSQKPIGEINDNFSRRKNLMSKRKNAEMTDLITKNILRISDLTFDVDMKNKKFQLLSKRNAQKCSQICLSSEQQQFNSSKKKSFEGLFTFSQLTNQNKPKRISNFIESNVENRNHFNRSQSMRSLCSLKNMKKDGLKNKTYRKSLQKFKKEGKDYRNLQMLSQTLQQKTCPILHRFYKILMKNKAALTIHAFSNRIQSHLKKLQTKRMKDMENSKMRRDGISKNSMARFARTAPEWSLLKKLKNEGKQKAFKKGILKVNKMKSENNPRQKYSKPLNHQMQFEQLRIIEQQKHIKSKKSSHHLITSQIEIDANEPQEVQRQMLEKCYKKSKQSIQDLKNKIMKRQNSLSNQSKNRKCLKKSQTYFYL